MVSFATSDGQAGDQHEHAVDSDTSSARAGARFLAKQQSVNRSRKAIALLSVACEELRSQGDELAQGDDEVPLPSPVAVQRFLSRRMSRKASPAAGDDEAASPRPGSSSSIHAAASIAAAEGGGAAAGPGRKSAEGEAVAATLGIELDAVVLEDKPAPRGKGKGH